MDDYSEKLNKIKNTISYLKSDLKDLKNVSNKRQIIC